MESLLLPLITSNRLLQVLTTYTLGYLFVGLKFHDFLIINGLWISYGLIFIIDPWIPIVPDLLGARYWKYWGI